MKLDTGFWLFLSSQDIRDEFNLQDFAEFLRGTTGGVESDTRDVECVTIMTKAFCQAYNLSLVKEEKLPEPMRGHSSNVFMLARLEK